MPATVSTCAHHYVHPCLLLCPPIPTTVSTHTYCYVHLHPPLCPPVPTAVKRWQWRRWWWRRWRWWWQRWHCSCGCCCHRTHRYKEEEVAVAVVPLYLRQPLLSRPSLQGGGAGDALHLGCHCPHACCCCHSSHHNCTCTHSCWPPGLCVSTLVTASLFCLWNLTSTCKVIISI